jgi:hypothetical protein
MRNTETVQPHPYRKPVCRERNLTPEKNFALSGNLESFDELDDYVLS